MFVFEIVGAQSTQGEVCGDEFGIIGDGFLVEKQALRNVGFGEDAGGFVEAFGAGVVLDAGFGKGQKRLEGGLFIAAL